ncbi:HEPN domain-containing protein [Parapedobacter koreensis]|uniref:Uncharacterized protein n=1 Tax=Parapedobacter koreensis TaxID=332977 RepID=A0A1H7FJ73_9SPHI|nr:HEPN domain-containing protein [Parapedobacter koreensis]SEK25297.1 hypothetical protein SAMN05421740_101349 [Parapedobacter koreensis]
MAFTLTHFIYPLKDKIILSNSMGYALDNPRSQEEENLIKEFVIKSVNWGGGNNDDNPALGVAFGLRELTDYLKANDKTAFDIIQEYHTDNTIDIIVKAWIILRYQDDGFFEQILEKKTTLIPIIYGGDNNHPFLNSFNQVIGYTGLISLLLNRNGHYYGENLIPLKYPQEIFYESRDNDLYYVLEDFKHIGIFLNENKPVHKKWIWFPLVADDVRDISQLLESVLTQTDGNKSSNKKQSPKEKLLFVGNLLRVILHETYDIKVKLLLLVSIIEFLLTRNPDFNRFNVEDSISKQFKLKATTLIYLNDKTRDLDEIHNNLNYIYNQRSDIAHGNYISHKDEATYLESIDQLYDYIGVILIEYLKDRDFVDYLKRN